MLFSHFDWNDIKFFLAVARDGTVSAAARQLGVEHTTVIRRIDALERDIGVRLFERTPRGYFLTLTGERLLESADKIADEASRVQATVAGENTIGGVVRISCLEAFGNFFLAPILPKIQKQFPRLKVKLLTIQQIVALSNREANLMITVNPPQSHHFESTHLVDYTLYIYGSKKYLKDKPVTSKQDILKHRFAGYIDDLVFSRDLNYLHEISPGLKADMQSASIHAQMEFTASGYGLCILPAYIARQKPNLVKVLPEIFKLKRAYWLVTHARQTTYGSRSMSDFIKSEVQKNADIFD